MADTTAIKSPLNLCCCGLVVLNSVSLFGQENRIEEKHNSLSANMAFSIIPRDLGERFDEVLILMPTLGLKYDRHLNAHWRIGLHADFLLGKFELVKEDTVQSFDRSYPVNLCVMAAYTFENGILLSAGIGQEFESEKTFTTLALGIEYEIEISDYWDVIVMSSWDYRVSHYSSFILGIGFARFF